MEVDESNQGRNGCGQRAMALGRTRLRGRLEHPDRHSRYAPTGRGIDRQRRSALHGRRSATHPQEAPHVAGGGTGRVDNEVGMEVRHTGATHRHALEATRVDEPAGALRPGGCAQVNWSRNSCRWAHPASVGRGRRSSRDGRLTRGCGKRTPHSWPTRAAWRLGAAATRGHGPRPGGPDGATGGPQAPGTARRSRRGRTGGTQSPGARR